MLAEVWRHRHLVLAMAGRAVKARYAGSLLGTAWALVEPLLQFALYLVVFGVFLGLRGFSGGGGGFALWLLAGLVPFLLLQEGWVRAASCFRAQANLVKHVPVPLSALLASELVAVLARHGVLLALLLGFALTLGNQGPPLLPSLVGAVLAALLLLVGGALWLSVAGAYLPDVGPVTSSLMGFALYLTPILYPETLLPEKLRPWVAINPLWTPVALMRTGLGLPVVVGWAGIGLVLGVVLLLAGVWFFRRREAAVRDLV